ncbi:MAG: dTDP-4-dehydrorhamnose 3,5-epimerase family protein [Pseudomonadota bacterium]
MDSVSKERFLIAGSNLSGVEITRGVKHVDARGSFTEMYCDEWGLCIRPSQWSVVESEARVLRGMHLHKRHDEYFSVISGHACVGLYDIRPDSPTFAQSCLIDLPDTERIFVSFPRGIIHGWYFFERTFHLQAVSESYVDYHKDDNIRCSWADPKLNIAWPDLDPIVSELASDAGSVDQCRAVMDRD